MANGVGEVLNLLLDEEANDGGLAECLHRHRHGVHARLGAMAGAEGVVDVGVREGRKAGDVGLVVPLLFPLVEPHVLQHEHAARGQGPGLGMGIGAAGVGGERDGLAEQFAEPRGHRRQ